MKKLFLFSIILTANSAFADLYSEIHRCTFNWQGKVNTITLYQHTPGGLYGLVHYQTINEPTMIADAKFTIESTDVKTGNKTMKVETEIGNFDIVNGINSIQNITLGDGTTASMDCRDLTI